MKVLPGMLVLILPLLCAAEVVVPIASVEEHVNIRLSPDPKSEIVGHLDQGDSAALVATSDGWHEVEIVGGSTGFISADWTIVLAEVPELVDEAAAVGEVVSGVETGVAVIDTTLAPDPIEDEAVIVDAVGETEVVTVTGEPEVVAAEVADEEQVEQVVDILTEEPELQVAETSDVVEEREPTDKEPATEIELAAEEVVVTDGVEVAGIQATNSTVEEVVENSSVPSDESLIVPVVVGTQGTRGETGPAGPPGKPGAATIKGTENYVVKFSRPEIGGNSQIYDDGNRIGIGTTEPKQRLEVNGSIQIHEQNSSVAGLMITQSSGDTGYIMHNRASTLTIGAGSVDRITIDRDGNVGIGVSRPKHPIEMVSGAHVTAGGVWTNSSSRARKENISELGANEALAALAQLQPVQFNYKSEQQETYVGFIAEDVPALVANNGRDSLSTMDIVAVLTRVVQAQQQKIDELEARLNSAK